MTILMMWRTQTRRRIFRQVTAVLLAVLVVESSQWIFEHDLFTSFGTVAYAETADIEPNADGTVAATPTGCPSSNFSCLDDGLTTADTPNSGTDYVQFGNGTVDFYQMEDIPSVDTVSSITVYLYHANTGNTNMGFSLGLYAANEVTQYGTIQNLPQRTSAQWDSITFTGLSLTQAQLNDLRIRLACDRLSGGQPGGCRGYALYATVTYDPVIDVTVAALGTQQNIDAGATNAYVGGAFSLVRNVGSGAITSITLTESGTVDAATDLSNIKLFYDLDTTSPYDCASESYAGTEPQFGSTVTGGFTSANGTATFTDSVNITTTQTMCVYVVLDVSSTAPAGNTLELSIANPTTDVGFAGSFIEPATAVALPGTTIIQRTDVTLTGYHWRNDDGNEAGATSATGGSENTPFSAAPREQTLRLRTALSNEGNKTSDPAQYRLEYATKVTNCASATGWTNVGAAGGNWEMSPTTNLTDGADTTNISVGIGGITDPNTTFLTPNGGVRDTTSQTGNITLTSTQFVELEYAIEATAIAGDGITYCFRVTDAGTPIATYDVYPEATTFSDLTVGTIGTQVATVDIPTSNVYAGGAFTIVDQTAGGHTVSSIALSAGGTLDPTVTVENVRLFYEYDTSAPYDCTSESYAGSETQYGSTVGNLTAGGVANFTDTLTVNPTQAVCLYVVYDVPSAATDGQTIDWRIADPSMDVVIDAGDIGPAAQVSIAGDTTVQRVIVRQSAYHWRNNDGSETTATSATGGSPNTTIDNVRRGSTVRLRLAVENEGGKTAPTAQYRIEWVQQTSTCAAATGWTDVGAAGGAWDMSPTANLTNGANTTNIPDSAGGVPDPEPTFLTPNGGVRDTTSQTGNITLAGDEFVELEYSIEPTDTALEGASYCFRVTNAGTPLDEYGVYPVAQVKFATDFFIQRGVTTITGGSATINAGTNYEAPASASNAFIRITGTNHSGTGAGTEGNADDVTAYISNPGNIATSITFTRPASAIGSTRIAWEIIEYTGAPGGQNELIVRQHGTQTYGGANTTVTTGTVSNVVDDNKIAVFITGQANPDTTTNFPRGLSTAVWNGGSDTATFTRGESGNAAQLSYAVVEFTGSNWRIQRSEHTYTAVGTPETEDINPVNSLSRTFLHTQKRMGAGRTTHGDYGHLVSLQSIGSVTYTLDSTATTPGTHTSVAWVIENTQTAGERMIVTRSSGTQSGGTAPLTLNTNIGKTLPDLDIAALFVTNTGDESGGGPGQNSFPEPIIATRLISNTQYEVFVPDTNDSRSWQTEVVEWPTAARTYTQNYYRFYVDNDALTPTDPWPAGVTNIGENSEVTVDDVPIGIGQTIRLRMSVHVTAAGAPPGIDSFKLQYGERVTTCGAVSNWNDIGTNSSSTAIWRGAPSSVSPGTPLSTDPPVGGDLLLSVSDVAGTFENRPSSGLTPYFSNPGEDIEYDWAIQHNGATDKTVYCFRMLESNNIPFVGYNFYPAIRTAGYEPRVLDWRWYDDETSLTPSLSLGAENVSPSNVENQNVLKLRVLVGETAGAPGQNAKFSLQFSEYSDFSQKVATVVATSTCEASSLWCYADGAGNDNDPVDAAVLTNADACTAGTGPGCGTHNEAATTSSSFTHQAFSNTEFEFTLRHAGARVNAVYYFRLYDEVNDTPVETAIGSSNPSLATEGPQIVFSVGEVGAGQEIAGVVTNGTSTATTIDFGRLPIGSDLVIAQAVGVDSNSTDGYQVFLRADQQPTNAIGEIIQPIGAANASPESWSTACTPAAVSCFGYHSTDATLSGGNGRFAPIDSYAALSTSMEEILFSSVPANETNIIVYRMRISELQPPGDYETSLTYTIVPVY